MTLTSEQAVISPSFNRHYTLTIRETQSQPGNMATKTTLPGGKVHDLPADLAAALMDDETAKAVWLDITVLARNEFICWVSDAKQASTRERRIRRTVEELNEGKRRPCCWPGCSHRERTGK